jgi:hypothetical protein
MLDEELFVIFERASFETHVPGTSLFGVKRYVAREDDGDFSIPAAGVNLAQIQSGSDKEAASG